MAQAINEEFNPWVGAVSPDGIWRLAGTWFGTGNNQFDLSRETLTSTYPGETDTGFLNLTITPSTNPLQGGEIQTLGEYGYGFYEVRMKPSAVSGGVASFFLADFDGPWHEYDIEFLLNSHNQVTFSNYNGAWTTYYDLGFDPTADFHTYGILWEPGKVTNYVDGVAVHSETNGYFVSDADGMTIMMNAWSGNANFGAGPPAQNSTTVYDWVHFTPLGDTSPPPPPPPSAGAVSINNASVSEGDSGTKSETFTVTRSGGTAAFDVNFATSNGSATTTDNDYAAKSGTLHFAAGQNTQTISVVINGDTKVEANETFTVNLSNATNGATISDGQGVGTIVNNDSTVPPPPTAPDAVNDTARTRRNTPITIDVLANDRDPNGDPLSIIAVSDPVHGTAAINGDAVLYTPDPRFRGADSFTYTISDGAQQDTAKVAVTVAGGWRHDAVTSSEANQLAQAIASFSAPAAETSALPQHEPQPSLNLTVPH